MNSFVGFFAQGWQDFFTANWQYIVMAVLALLVIILIAVLAAKKRRPADPRRDLEVAVPAFEKPLLNKQNEMFITVPRNVTYGVGETGQIRPGSYILRNAMGEKGSFNLRYNGLVTEVQNDTKITLGEGDSLCCVSDSIVVVADL